MTPTEFRTARERLGMSPYGRARLLRLSGPTAIRHWEKGRYPVPGPVRAAMAWLLAGNLPDLEPYKRKRIDPGPQ